MKDSENEMNVIERIESLQEAHKILDRECTDLEKQLAGCYNDDNHDKLSDLKKKKLQVKDEIEQLRKQVDLDD